MSRFCLATIVAAFAWGPSPIRADVIEVKRVVYAEVDGVELTIDLFLPAGGGTDRKAILWFHGGGWSGGTPKQFFPQSRRLAAQGIVCGSVRYRLSKEAPFPACLNDCKAAVRYLRAEAAKFGVDPDRIGVGGGSAGAHLAAMVALTPGMLEDQAPPQEQSDRVAFMILFNPPTDLRPMGESPAIKRLSGVEHPTDERLARMSPVSYVTSDAPPALLLHGDADRTVPHIHSAFLHRQLQQAKVKSTLFTAPGAGHGWFNRGDGYESTIVEVEKFLRDK